MPMTTTVKLSLLALRGYLVVMMLMVLYHVMDLAGVFGQHAREERWLRFLPRSLSARTGVRMNMTPNRGEL